MTVLETPPGTNPTVACLAARGGCGASLLAGALALTWAAAGRRPLLVDLDLVRGDLARAWSIPTERSLADLVPVIEELGPGHLRRAAFPHPSGVSVIAAPGAPDPLPWSAAAGARLLRAAADAWDGVVVDLGAGDGRVAAGAVAAAGHVLLVCPPTIAGARRARVLGERLAALGAGGTAHVVIAPVAPGSELTTRAFARASGLAVAAALPRADAEARDLSAGCLRRGRRRRLAAAIAAIAEVVA